MGDSLGSKKVVKMLSLTIEKFKENLAIVLTNFLLLLLMFLFFVFIDDKDLFPKLIPFGTLVKVNEKDLLKGFEQ